MTNYRLRPVFLLAGVLAFGIFTGCSKSNPVTKPSGTGSDISLATSLTESLESLPVLKIAAVDWAYVAEQKGWFQDFTNNGTKIEIIQGTSGNEAQLMARGELYFANRMLYPYMQFFLRGADVIGVEVSEHPDPVIASIIVLKDSPYQTFDDLRGKKIMSYRLSCPYMVLFEITEDKGWVEGKDWIFMDVHNSVHKTALLSKEVDAVSWHPTNDMASILVSGQAREIAHPEPDSVYIQGGGVTVTFVPASFAQSYPNVIRRYLEIKIASQTWILENMEEAAAIVESITRTPPDVSKFSWERYASTWKMTRDLEKVIAETNVLQAWLVEHNDLEKVIDSSILFDPQFFD